MSAVRTLQHILHEGRTPTPAELNELQRFPGWGATQELFDPNSTKYAPEREALKEMWSDTEWDAARKTVLYAHYTHADYVSAMWAALDRLGVPHDAQILEPGCGIGNFIGQARPGQQLTGIELDPTTAAIAQLLHPDADIRAESFVDTMLEHEGYDATIGNVPFERVRLHDPIYNPARLSIHNHFIVKSLRMVKPGGIVAVLTSRWTLDGKPERARREIAKYGELLGAVRMPAGAHGEIAGTDAVIDLLVLRRHMGEAPETEPAWIRTINFKGPAGTAPLSSYFRDNPTMVLGNVTTESGPFGPRITVAAPDTSADVIAPKFSAALERVVDDAIEHDRLWAAKDTIVTDRPVARIVQDPDKVIGHISVHNETGLLQQIGLNGLEPVNVPKNAVRELTLLIRIRDSAVQLLEAEAATSDDTQTIADLRTKLNSMYDRYVATFGPLGRSTTTVRERAGKDPIITRRYPAAIRAFRSDPHYATVAALEDFNENTGVARKATIFTERVVGVRAEVDRAETPEDAIRISLDRVGHVDVPLVAELLDIDEQSVPATLGERVFVSPEDPNNFITAEEFLSGNVRLKRNRYRELASIDATFRPHLDALEKIIPEEVGPAEIAVKFGASWVPISDVETFIHHELRSEVKAIERIEGEWKFKLVGSPSPTAEGKWGVKGDVVVEEAEQVFQRVLNGERLQLRYRPHPDQPYMTDQVGTEALQERAQALHDAFQDWLWSDAERVQRLQERYNDLYNGIVLRSYDGIKLSFPGKAATFEPRPHQHAAVARMLAEPAVGLFHEVGAGKTAEMVLGVMEMRRLGLAVKPAIIVPNQMLDQFMREFKQIYPRAKVLTAGSEDISTANGKDGRKLFVARARTGDWDAVIMTHSSFSKIGLGNSQKAFATERLAEMKEIHEAKLSSALSGRSVKRLESALAAQQEKLKQLKDLPYDAGVTWEETGIDYLCIDEAHLFKNLTVLSKVDDLAKPVGSGRATDLDMKLWYHRDFKQQSRVCTLATATPLPNSIIEMYVMMKYLRPDLLREAQVYLADDWAKQFTEQITAVEAKPDGGGYQVKTRTVKFTNMPELLRMWHIPGDVKTQADLALPIPQLALNSEGKRAPEMAVVPALILQKAGMAAIVVRGEEVRNRAVDPSKDNMLKITSNGRALALDARLFQMSGDESERVTEAYEIALERLSAQKGLKQSLGHELRLALAESAPVEDERCKVDHVADQVYRIWELNKDNEYLNEWGESSSTRGALQIVFSDLGTPALGGRWDAYTHLRRTLVAKGIPVEQIRFIHEAKNDKQKAELFQQSRDGRVQVLVGSTEKMGVGTNVQARCVALHHIDAPWRPADVTQREGRAIRQGNQNAEVEIIRYATEGSFDAYMWGTLSRKAQFIEQVLSGRLDVREVDNSTEMALQFAEMQAITAGDMRILEAANLRSETQKLGRQERGYGRKITAISVRRDQISQAIDVAEHDLTVMRKLASKIVDTRGDLFAGRVQRSTWADAPLFRERKEFGQALRTNLIRARNDIRYFGEGHARYPAPLKLTVTIAGLEWDAQLRWNTFDSGDPYVEFSAGNTHRGAKHEMLWSRVLEGDLSKLSQGFETRARDLPQEIADLETLVIANQNEVEQMRVMAAEPWPKKDELRDKLAKLANLVEELEIEAQEPNMEPTAPPAPILAAVPSGPTMQL